MRPITNYKSSNFVIVYYTEKETYHVFSGEYGGYLYGDSWRLSTAIKSVSIDNDQVIVHTRSGSSYELDRNCIRMTGYMGSIYSGYENDMAIVVNDSESFDKWLELWKNN